MEETVIEGPTTPLVNEKNPPYIVGQRDDLQLVVNREINSYVVGHWESQPKKGPNPLVISEKNAL